VALAEKGRLPSSAESQKVVLDYLEAIAVPVAKRRMRRKVVRIPLYSIIDILMKLLKQKHECPVKREVDIKSYRELIGFVEELNRELSYPERVDLDEICALPGGGEEFQDRPGAKGTVTRL
jgi:hypothetical protein